jgi:hypothetical protein
MGFSISQSLISRSSSTGNEFWRLLKGELVEQVPPANSVEEQEG